MRLVASLSGIACRTVCGLALALAVLPDGTTALARSVPLPVAKPDVPARASAAPAADPETPVAADDAAPLPAAKPVVPTAAADGTPLPLDKPLHLVAPRYLTPTDLQLYRAAFKEAHARRWAEAERIAGKASERLPGVAVTWMRLRSDDDASYAEIEAFRLRHPEWDALGDLDGRAEEALARQGSNAALLARFAASPPGRPLAMVRYGEALLATGETAKGEDWIRRGWVAGDFDAADEARIWRRHRALFTASHNIERLDRLLWDQRRSAAGRMLRRVDQDYRSLAEARLALMGQLPGVDGAVRRVAARYRDDPGLAFERARWRRRAGLDDGAQEILLDPPAALGRADAWWGESRIQVRELLRKGFITDAYRLAAGHRLESGGSEFAEAEWLAGWVALRFLRDSQVALTHFRTLYENVSYPVSRARGAYWAARAAEAMGERNGAARWYGLAATHRTTFYGQLAAGKAGLRPGLDEAPPITIRAAARRDFDRRELVRAALMLAEVGEDSLVRRIVRNLSRTAKTREDHLLVVGLGERMGSTALAHRAAKEALKDGIVLLDQGWPVELGVAPAPDIELPLVMAVIRQESGFDDGAVSHAGARGLMQIMPATARQVAGELKIRYSHERLLGDPFYNSQIGSRYLADLIARFDGSYVLALVAYNAGEGRARRWIRDWGDPRSGAIDPIDWIELIPFTETRNYVQRVLENLQVYRSRMHGSGALPDSLHTDLERAMRGRADS